MECKKNRKRKVKESYLWCCRIWITKLCKWHDECPAQRKLQSRGGSSVYHQNLPSTGEDKRPFPVSVRLFTLKPPQTAIWHKHNVLELKLEKKIHNKRWLSLHVVLNTGGADVTGADLKVQITNANCRETRRKLLFRQRNSLYALYELRVPGDARVSSWRARGVSRTLMRTCSVPLPPAANHTSDSPHRQRHPAWLMSATNHYHNCLSVYLSNTSVTLNNIYWLKKNLWIIKLLDYMKTIT